MLRNMIASEMNSNLALRFNLEKALPFVSSQLKTIRLILTREDRPTSIIMSNKKNFKSFLFRKFSPESKFNCGQIR